MSENQTTQPEQGAPGSWQRVKWMAYDVRHVWVLAIFVLVCRLIEWRR